MRQPQPPDFSAAPALVELTGTSLEPPAIDAVAPPVPIAKDVSKELFAQ